MGVLFVSILLFSVSFLAGCSGPMPNASPGTPAISIVEGAIEPFIEINVDNSNKVNVSFGVKNQTRETQELVFTSGQRFDYQLKDDKGKILEHYSIDKIFIQVIETISLKPGDELRFDEVFEDLPAGEYSFEFWITAKDKDLRAKATFSID